MRQAGSGPARRIARCLAPPPIAGSAPLPSTVIRRFAYDPDRAELDILFTTGRRYLYRAVPPEAHDALAAALSKGRYFNAHVRDVFEHEEVTPEAGHDGRRRHART